MPMDLIVEDKEGMSTQVSTTTSTTNNSSCLSTTGTQNISVNNSSSSKSNRVPSTDDDQNEFEEFSTAPCNEMGDPVSPLNCNTQFRGSSPGRDSIFWGALALTF